MLELVNVLVTGGAGFLGSHLVKRLLELGHDVKVLDNDRKFGERNLKDVLDKIEFTEADVRNYDKVRELMRDVDIVYHLAAIAGTSYFYTHPCLVLDVGLLGMINVLKAITESNVKRLLFTSSSEVYATPKEFTTPETHPLVVPDVKNPRYSYSSTKIVSEILCINYAKKYGFDATIVRLHNVYGPNGGWDHVIPEFIKRIVLNEKFTVQGNGTTTRSFCYIDDAIEWMILAATKDEGRNEIFNIGNQKAEITINQLIKYLEKISGKKIIPVHIPEPPGGTYRRNPDISKAIKLLAYEPKTGIKEGLKITYDWYKKEIEWWVKNKNPDEYPWNKKYD